MSSAPHADNQAQNDPMENDTVIPALLEVNDADTQTYPRRPTSNMAPSATDEDGA